ncbi:MAG TPA: PaaI family thioesterase [Thermoleophilia bacterium]|nr:PaaI family thioesterase [Thermoleophilia bacterium]
MQDDHYEESPPSSRRRVVAAQNITRMCLVCGTENVHGLRGRFYELSLQDGLGPGSERPPAAGGRELLGLFTPREEHQSYPGRLHGGIAAAVLDETIGRAIVMAHPDTWGVTVELTVRYRRPMMLDRELRVLGRITRDGSRLFEGSGEILLEDGSVAVEARGKYLKMRVEDIAREGMDESQWFADERARPEWIDL